MDCARAKGWATIGAVAAALALAPAALAQGPAPDPAPSAGGPQPDALPSSGSATEATTTPKPQPTLAAPTVSVPTAPAPSATPAPTAAAPPPTTPAAPRRTARASAARKARAADRRARARARAHAREKAEARAARRQAERVVPTAPPPSFSVAATPVRATTDDGPDSALLAASLALCLVAFAGAGVVGRVRREAGLA
jgi:hypothetical protein